MKFIRTIHRGKLLKGKLVLNNSAWFRTVLLKYDDCPKVRIIIEKERGTRTKKQNNYYWGVVLEHIAGYMGESPEDLHEIFKAKYLKRKRVWRGAEMAVLESTTKLTTDEFSEYIERCIQEGAELGVVVPRADKNWNLIETTKLNGE